MWEVRTDMGDRDMNANDSAFPHEFGSTVTGSYNPECGLTKREYAAIEALKGLLANPKSEPEDVVHNRIVAVRNADGLIDELNKER
jgi:hypothetical protein